MLLCEGRAGRRLQYVIIAMVSEGGYKKESKERQNNHREHSEDAVICLQMQAYGSSYVAGLHCHYLQTSPLDFIQSVYNFGQVHRFREFRFRLEETLNMI